MNKKTKIVKKIFDHSASFYANFESSSSPILKFILEEVILRLVANYNKPRILDAGCGNGSWIKEISKRYVSAEMFGVDTSSRLLRVAVSKLREQGLNKNAHLINADALSTPIKSNSFNIILFVDTVQHIDAKLHYDLLKECWRLLMFGGIVVIVDKEKFSLYGIMMALKRRFMCLPPRYLTASYPSFSLILKHAEKLGFKNVYLRKIYPFKVLVLEKTTGV